MHLLITYIKVKKPLQMKMEMKIQILHFGLLQVCILKIQTLMIISYMMVLIQNNVKMYLII